MNQEGDWPRLLKFRFPVNCWIAFGPFKSAVAAVSPAVTEARMYQHKVRSVPVVILHRPVTEKAAELLPKLFLPKKTIACCSSLTSQVGVL